MKVLLDSFLLEYQLKINMVPTQRFNKLYWSFDIGDFLANQNVIIIAVVLEYLTIFPRGG